MSSTATVPVTKSLWEKLMRKAELGKWDFPITLSCNIYRKVWHSRKYGFHQEEDRDYIRLGDFPFLREIVNKVLELKPRGGRFHIDKDVVVLTASENYKCVCTIKRI